MSKTTTPDDVPKETPYRIIRDDNTICAYCGAPCNLLTAPGCPQFMICRACTYMSHVGVGEVPTVWEKE